MDGYYATIKALWDVSRRKTKVTLMSFEVNTFSVDDEHFPHNSKNLWYHFKCNYLKNWTQFLFFFNSFSESTLNFEHFQKRNEKNCRFAETLSKIISRINLFLIELAFIWPIITFFWRYCLRRARASLHASEDSVGLNSSDKAEKLKLILLKFIEPKFDFLF